MGDDSRIRREGRSSMGNVTRQFTGWRIGDAMRCCADTDLLSAWLDDRQAAGSRRRYSFRSEFLDGDEAVRHNQSEGALRGISVRSDRSCARVKSSLIEHLLAERIVAWGRKDTPMDDLTAIPASAWRCLRITDICKSVVRGRAPAKTKVFDVRIFPIVESPDAIDRLADRTFVEAFQMSLVDDPQLNVLRKRAVAIGGTPASFGDERHPYHAVWPMVLGQSSEIEPAIGFAGKSDEPTKYELVEATNRIQRQRFTKLVSYLSAGLLVAEGIPAAGGMSVTIPRSIWQQYGTYINLENGDPLEVSSRAKDRLSCPLRPLFTGLVLRKAESVHRISEIPLSGLRPVATSKVSKSKKHIVSKVASEKACSDWLIVLMRSSPDDRPEIKEFYWRKAHGKWLKSLSERGFDRAWAKAVAEAPAPAWSAGGAPKKSLQSKPPHQ